MAKVNGYSRLQIGLHWAIVVLIVLNYITSDKMKAAWHGLHKGQDFYGNTAALHVWGGIAILVLAIIRVILRLTRGAPDLPAGGNPVTDLIAKLTHLGLYLLTILIPIAGLVAWYGQVDAAGEAHELMFNLLLALVALHVAAAFYHQYVLKDGLIRRMMRAE